VTDAPSTATVVTERSHRSFEDTVSALVAAIEGAGLRVFDVIDHRAAALDVGLFLLPTQVVVFGSPAAGTPLMVDHPLLALELPLRILVSEDEQQQVWMSYLEPQHLAAQFGLTGDQAAVLAGPAKMLALAGLPQH
jgi:uncharacterized protein (DUF302 family)